ncbi:MAG TPA: amino acid ABC transporter substrate-binding protein [Cyanobacteria bacterium UBA11369]|nr:amino acid ABC transporter substrate-binding protein [Cyanobacteria bacterium UBA11371]HBE48150.1 amino acid ABC transporter substrate-binding protein [Cyanobacteria bacterium UBA11369]
MRKWGFLIVFTLPLLLSLTGCSGQSGQTSATGGTAVQGKSRLDTVKSRGKLICGVSGELPGFSFVDKEGNYKGLDVEVCRAIASAIFDNPDAVEFRNLNAKERFTALQTGEIDVLSRNTSWTISRDTSVGLEFAPVVFYDGQGIMVKKDSGIKTLNDLKDKAICTQTGTTNEQNLADQMRKRGIPYKPVVFEDINTAYATYAQGRCQAVTSDRSQLLSRKTTLPQPQNHVILNEVLSKEPLAPAVTNGDSRWFDVVKWSIYALINAEELGINSKNLASFEKSNDPDIKRFLGKEGNLGEGLGLTNDFAVRIVKHVGNYGEVYNRYLGPGTPFNLPRGQNNLWNKGGLLYSPPFR